MTSEGRVMLLDGGADGWLSGWRALLTVCKVLTAREVVRDLESEGIWRRGARCHG